MYTYNSDGDGRVVHRRRGLRHDVLVLHVRPAQGPAARRRSSTRERGRLNLTTSYDYEDWGDVKSMILQGLDAKGAVLLCWVAPDE